MLPPSHIVIKVYPSIHYHHACRVFFKSKFSIYFISPPCFSLVSGNDKLVKLCMTNEIRKVQIIQIVFERNIAGLILVTLTWSSNIPPYHSTMSRYDKIILRRKSSSYCCCGNCWQMLWYVVCNGCMVSINIFFNPCFMGSGLLSRTSWLESLFVYVYFHIVTHHIF